MIVRNLIHRPIAVTMCLIALIAIGCISFKYIPVSLMPDIDIPQITVQVSYPGASVHEVDAEVVAPLRSQLMQVAGLKDIHSESRMDAGSIFMEFEPGSNIDLIFIEVNEKIDRAMNRMPKELERPKVVKASAMDIPAFYLDLSLKNEGGRERRQLAEGRYEVHPTGRICTEHREQAHRAVAADGHGGYIRYDGSGNHLHPG